MTRISFIAVILSLCACAARAAEEPIPLPGTKPLTMEGDIASKLVEGVDTFLLRQTARAAERRATFWAHRDVSSPEAYAGSLQPNRARLAHILGVRDARVAFDAPELVASTTRPALVARGKGFEVFAVRWPAFGDVHGEGLLLAPVGKKAVADVVAIPDCAQTPEQIAGLADGLPAEAQFARRLAENGCRVLVPVLIDRETGPRPHLTNREFIYRSAYELGRHVVGYEVQKVLAGVDWFVKGEGARPKIGVIGYAEGGLIALYAAALDSRIDAACVSGYFGDRSELWREPIDRNVFGLLEQFGDAELASLITPRALVVEMARGPELTLKAQGGAPGRLVTPPDEQVRVEVGRAKVMVAGLKDAADRIVLAAGGEGGGAFLKALGAAADAPAAAVERLGAGVDAKARQARQIHELDRHNQQVLDDSGNVRREFLKKLDTSSVEKYEQSVKAYRDFFYEDVIGHFHDEFLPAEPRTRKFKETDKWVGYEVVLDVYPDVIAYGLLLLPKGMKEGEKRPVVVCQHGLEGRPQHTIGEGEGFNYYKAFSARLAERGFITFAPQNLYIFTDRFRTLQRKANPLKKTLYSVITPQHQQIISFLKTLPNVDGARIGFYGLSYGGKTAMRVPALLTDYRLSICSADFNEWVAKNASTRIPQSYVWSGEYEIFEFDLGSTFNYAEMAALIAPRPFMVERGHFDGVGTDEMVGYEFGKVKRLYNAQLKIGDRCEIEWFAGPHTINGVGTFDFLHKHLNWPKP